MGLILFALFLGIPLAEIALFVVIGGRIGVLATIAIVIVTAFAGAWLVRRQGLETLNRARADIERNVVPAGAMSEGLAILVAGAFLLTPGFLTDTIGFALLIPPVRRSLITAIGNWLASRVTVVDMGGGQSDSRRPGAEYGRRDDVVDVEAIEIEIDTNDTGSDPDGDVPEGSESGKQNPRGGPSPWRAP
jgi:UPF0716 protein FxsA